MVDVLIDTSVDVTYTADRLNEEVDAETRIRIARVNKAIEELKEKFRIPTISGWGLGPSNPNGDGWDE